MTSPTPLEVSREGVRRFLLEAQHLAGNGGPSVGGSRGVLEELRHLECVQIDPVAAVERNQHLTLAARLPGYTPAILEQLLSERRVFEYLANAACVIPIEDYPIFEGTRRRMRRMLQPYLAPIKPVARRVLTRLEREGPLPARAFDSKDRVRGWWDLAGPRTKATSHALGILADLGQIMVVRREGVERYFDLTERVVPPELLRRASEIHAHDADETLLQKYLRAFRVIELGDFRFGWRRMPAAERRRIVGRRVADGRIVPLAVEGVARRYFVLAEDVETLERHHRAARSGPADSTGARIRFLPPLDNLLWRRERIADLFGFAYTWEIYVPPAKRRYGYYTMPVLAGDRLIGRIDPLLDRERGRLVVNLLHLEPGVRPTRSLRRNLRTALEQFARFHGAGTVSVRRTRPSRLRL
jgi:uncharacterized protein